MAQTVKLLSDDSVGRILESARDNFTHIAETTRSAAILNWTKEAGFARQLVLRDERLLQADPDSIKNAITNVASTGLSLNPVKQHAVILSRWNDKVRRYEAQLVIMYRGLMWLAGQAGVTDIVIDVVYSTDKINITRSSEGDKFEHVIAVGVPRDGSVSRFLGVYVAARMPGSKLQKVEWIPCEDIIRARDKSESYLDRSGEVRKSSPWVQWFDEMAKKTGLKRAQKRWEEAVVESSHEWKRFQTAVALDNANEGVIPARATDIPGTAEEKKDEKPVQRLSIPQITEIEKLVEQIAPNTDKFPNSVGSYMVKLARLYRCNALDEVPANKFDELKDRLNENLKKAQAKKAGKAGGEGQGTEGKGNAAVGKDSAKKDAAQNGNKAGAGGEREPGSDDDRDSPPDREAGDPGPTDPHEG